jgi:hypothetical protein
MQGNPVAEAIRPKVSAPFTYLIVTTFRNLHSDLGNSGLPFPVICRGFGRFSSTSTPATKCFISSGSTFAKMLRAWAHHTGTEM